MQIMRLPDKLVAVVALVAVGLLVSSQLTWPTRDAQFFGRSFALSGEMLFGIVLMGLGWTGAYVVVQPSAGTMGSGPLSFPPAGILPAALTGAAWVLLAQPSAVEVKLLGTLVTGGLLGAVLCVQYWIAAHSAEPSVDSAQLVLRLLAYLVAILSHVAIHLRVLDSLLAMVATAALGAIISLHSVDARAPAVLQTLPQSNALPWLLQQLARYRWLRALVLGAVLGAVSWLLGQWTPSPFVRSLVWAAAMYVAAGLTNSFLAGKLTRRVALEYALFGLVAVWLLLSYAR
jgi:hypothetical protein